MDSSKQETVRAEAAPEQGGTTTAARPRRRSWFRRLLLLSLLLCTPLALVLVGLAAIVLSLGNSDELSESTYNKRLWDGDEAKVAIIRVEGAIISGEGYVRKQIERVIDDPKVKAVVLRVNSPGGTIVGSDYILHHLEQMRKDRAEGDKPLPLVVSMGGIAASGGYYVSMAVGKDPDVIYAEPATWTGSIGVIIPHYNVAGFLDAHKIEEDSVLSHRLKNMGTITRKMTDEEKKIFQELVDESFARFKDIVLKGRPKLKADQLDKLATGQVFTSSQAIKNGLVDKEGFLEDAIRRAIGLAGLQEEDVRVVEYKRPPSLFDFLLVESKQQQPDARTLLDLTTPRGYYLCSWIPGVVTSRPAE